jgi:uncharacterized protein YcbK (DUF882 family)
MWMQRLRRVAVMVAVAAIALVGGSSKASEVAGTAVSAGARQYHLRMHHLHTGEDIDVVYRVGDTYLPEGIAKLNYFLRDHRTQDESTYDPKEFDLLNALMTRLGRPDGVIDIVCGYRTPWSNNFLRGGSASSGVAEHSQHMLAKAIDIRVPGVSTVKLRDAALALHLGGVGYYPVSQFVHVDVGPVREWSFMPRSMTGHASRSGASGE